MRGKAVLPLFIFVEWQAAQINVTPGFSWGFFLKKRKSARHKGKKGQKCQAKARMRPEKGDYGVENAKDAKSIYKKCCILCNL